MDIRQTDKAYLACTYGRADVVFARGKGSCLYDETGKRYIDFGTGIAVNGLGIADDGWLAAVKAQLDLIPHASNLYYTRPAAELARELCTRAGMRKVFFGNSGAEANECAIKCARKYSFDKYGSGRNKIVSLSGSFHGRTLATLTATGQDVFHRWFDPFPEGFVYVPAGDFSALEEAAEGAAAVILEPVQGEGGVTALDRSYVERLVAFCRARDILVIADEVQTGNGRTGALFAYMRYGFTPDIATTAKGLGNGLPIGACMFGEKTADVLGPGTHGSTFGGNPAVCAGALEVLRRIDEPLLRGVLERERVVRAALAGAKGVKQITGLGLMLGVECDRPGKEIAAECLARGLVVLTAKEKVRLLPALNIPLDLLSEGLEILREVLS